MGWASRTALVYLTRTGNATSAKNNINKANPSLVRSNLDGTGHDFYVDRLAGFNPNQQTDLINFLLALDDVPGSF